MSKKGQRAFGYARLRARKSRMLEPQRALALAGKRAEGLSSLLEARGVRGDSLAEIGTALLDGLVQDYEMALASYPTAVGPLTALVRLHEIENLKLGWRASVLSLGPEAWSRHWQQLGGLASLDLDDWREASSLSAALLELKGTAYESIAHAVRRAHGSDLLAAELAFDRWATGGVVRAARELPSSERRAAELLLGVARQRDFDVLRRARPAYGFDSDAAIAATVLLPTELDTEQLHGLAEWSPDRGLLGLLLPHRLTQGWRVRNWEEWAAALVHQCRLACRRALVAAPFTLAPPIAFLLLREDEVRCCGALAELRALADTVDRFDEAVEADRRAMALLQRFGAAAGGQL